jgi:hypothetical protein
MPAPAAFRDRMILSACRGGPILETSAAAARETAGRFGLFVPNRVALQSRQRRSQHDGDGSACVNDLGSEGWAGSRLVPLCRHAGVVEISNGWWAESRRGGRTRTQRHRLRMARDNEGRRIAACGVRAPNGWTEAGEGIGVACQECLQAGAIEELGSR